MTEPGDDKLDTIPSQLLSLWREYEQWVYARNRRNGEIRLPDATEFFLWLPDHVAELEQANNRKEGDGQERI